MAAPLVTVRFLSLKSAGAREEQMTVEAVRALIASRQLRSTDLVSLGKTWTPIGESPLFEEDARPLVKQEKRARRMRNVALIGLAYGVMAVLLWSFFRPSESVPASPDEALREAVALIEAEQFAAAVPRLEASVKAESLDPSTRAPAFGYLGRALLEVGERPRALEAFDEGIELSADLAPLHAGRGNALKELERFEEADAAFARALELDPRSVEALEGLALVRISQDRLDEALSLLKRAVAIAPEHPGLHGALAATHAALGDADAAEASLKEAVRLGYADEAGLRALMEALRAEGAQAQ